MHQRAQQQWACITRLEGSSSLPVFGRLDCAYRRAQTCRDPFCRSPSNSKPGLSFCIHVLYLSPTSHKNNSDTSRGWNGLQKIHAPAAAERP